MPFCHEELCGAALRTNHEHASVDRMTFIDLRERNVDKWTLRLR
jgi:hypothetical protein